MAACFPALRKHGEAIAAVELHNNVPAALTCCFPLNSLRYDGLARFSVFYDKTARFDAS
jgi:hypothetical protein